MQHERVSGDKFDYLTQPAPSGYRGVHDVYAWKARKGRPEAWNGLKVEIQYRTVYQHAWATAVEVAERITGDRTKFSQGSQAQQEFFRLASEIIARAHENANSCKPELSNRQLIAAFDDVDGQLQLLRKLQFIRLIKDHISPGSGDTILRFWQEDGSMRMEARTFASRPSATKRYFQLEQEHDDTDVDIVLVRAESAKAIKNAFRNYFADAQDFVTLVKEGKETLAQ